MLNTAMQAATAFWIASVVLFPMTGAAQTIMATLWFVMGCFWLFAFAVEAVDAYRARRKQGE
jgi:hypothetical protein